MTNRKPDWWNTSNVTLMMKKMHPWIKTFEAAEVNDWWATPMNPQRRADSPRSPVLHSLWSKSCKCGWTPTNCHRTWIPQSEAQEKEFHTLGLKSPSLLTLPHQHFTTAYFENTFSSCDLCTALQSCRSSHSASCLRTGAASLSTPPSGLGAPHSWLPT